MNEQLIEIATEWAQRHPNFLEDFVGMIEEYRTIVHEAGVDPNSLTKTKACLVAVGNIFETLEGK